MKKILYSIAALICILFWSSCNKFLDITPQGAENSDNFLTQKDNAITAVNGVYDILQYAEGYGPDGQWLSHHQDFFIGDIMSDDAEKGSNDADYGEMRDMVGWKMTPSNGFSYPFWVHGFWGISRANYVIENLPNVTWNDDKLKSRLMGEVLFLRAYNYWYLVRIFGGIPIFTKSVLPSEFGNVKRASLHECYLQMEKDLKQAIDMVPERSQYAAADMGRVTKGAVRSLLARIYMFQIGTDKECTTTWQQVYDLTKAVIASGEYHLLSNYAMLLETENDNSSESIFDIQDGLGSNPFSPNSIGTNFYNFQGNRKDDSGWGFDNPTIDLVKSYDVSDPRLSCIIYGDTYNGGILYGKKRKYDRQEQGTDWLSRKAALPVKPSLATACDRNIKLIRYADVLLMNAEAAYYIGKEAEAQANVNQIRNRARNSTYCMGFAENKVDYSSKPASVNLPDIKSTGTQLLSDIWKERRMELAMEQQRFYDLVRTGQYVDAMAAEKDIKRAEGQPYVSLYRYSNIKANIISKSIDGPNGHKVPLWPIPQTEVQAWGLQQNPGY